MRAAALLLLACTLVSVFPKESPATSSFLKNEMEESVNNYYLGKTSEGSSNQASSRNVVDRESESKGPSSQLNFVQDNSDDADKPPNFGTYEPIQQTLYGKYKSEMDDAKVEVGFHCKKAYRARGS